MLRGSLELDLGSGRVQLSRNARWALLSPQADATPPTPTLIDLSTGRRAPVPQGPPGTSNQTLASDGTVLVVDGDRFELWKEGKITQIDTGNWRALILSDNAHVVILGVGQFLQPFLATNPLIAMDLVSGGKKTLFRSEDGRQLAVFMGMSNDGGKVLYRLVPASGPFDGPAYVADTLTGESKPVTLSDGELVADGTLSGSGELAVLSTTRGRLVTVRCSTGEITTLIAPTPYVGSTWGLVPGSLFHLAGALTGSLVDWTGSVVLDDRTVPVIYARPGDVGIQIPWDQNLGYVPFRLNIPSDSPFVQLRTVLINQIAPNFEPLGPGETSVFPIKLVRGDWSGLLDKAPGPGDIVHMYLTGLGTVDGIPQTGVAASLVTLNPIKGEITCGFNSIRK